MSDGEGSTGSGEGGSASGKDDVGGGEGVARGWLIQNRDREGLGYAEAVYEAGREGQVRGRLEVWVWEAGCKCKGVSSAERGE